jgi:membrane-associated phospholipid phosphatase
VAVNAKKPNTDRTSTQQRRPGAFFSVLPRRALFWAAAFVVFTVLVGFQVTLPLDLWILRVSQSFSVEALDFSSSFVTLLGNSEVTVPLTLWLAFSGWSKRGLPGLAPVLLLVGVGIEVILKFTVPQIGPAELLHHKHIPALWHFATPYAFPSGHMVRTTFLVIYLTSFFPRWRWTGSCFVALMAVTRIYMNEHWTSDVIGGWLLGLAFAAVAVAIDPAASRTAPQEAAASMRAAS